MPDINPELTVPTFITLGPEGTCHSQVAERYIEFQGLASQAKLELVADFIEGVDRVHDETNSFLIQCSAHPEVHTVTERHPQEVFVADTFLYPNIPLALLVRRDVEEPKSLAIVPAAEGYTDLKRWETVSEEAANPIVARKLLEGEFDAGVTFAKLAEEHPDTVRVEKSFGEVDTTWLVYGKRRRYRGELIGTKIPWLFTGGKDPAA